MATEDGLDDQQQRQEDMQGLLNEEGTKGIRRENWRGKVGRDDVSQRVLPIELASATSIARPSTKPVPMPTWRGFADAPEGEDQCDQSGIQTIEVVGKKFEKKEQQPGSAAEPGF